MDKKYRFNPQTGEKEILKGYHKETGEPIYLKDNKDIFLILSLIFLILSLSTKSIIFSVAGLIFGLISNTNNWQKKLVIIGNVIILLIQLVLIIILLIDINIKKDNDNNFINETVEEKEEIFNLDDFFNYNKSETNTTLFGYYVCSKTNTNQKLAIEFDENLTFSYINFQSTNAKYIEGLFTYEKTENNNTIIYDIYLNNINNETIKSNILIKMTGTNIAIEDKNKEEVYECTRN